MSEQLPPKAVKMVEAMLNEHKRIIESLRAENARLREALAFAEAEGRQVFMDENERHMESREEVKRLREALATAREVLDDINSAYCSSIVEEIDKALANETPTA